MGDFDKNMFFKQKISAETKRVLRNISFNQKEDKILFHSITTIEPYYNVIGSLRKNIDFTKYEKNNTDKGLFYKRILFKKNGIYEAVFPIDNIFFSLTFYEKTLDKELKNLPDYKGMTNYTLEAITEKKCEKENFHKLSNIYFHSDSLGDYLTYDKLKFFESRVNKKELGYFRQYLSTYYSFAQKYSEADTEFNKLFKSYYSDKKITLTPLNDKDLLNNIQSERLVIFSEAHHFPAHRYLIGKLLEDFYNQGFRYLAIEALNKNNLLDKNGFPTLSDGFYIKEPNMANLIREAKNMGFIVFGYDSFEGNREYNQAKNIFEKTFDIDKEAKVLVLCGYGHIDENKDRKRMANQFKISFGIDPYTIEQSSYRDKEPTDELFLLFSESNNMECDMYINNSLIIKNNCFELRESEDVILDFPYSYSKNQLGIILIYLKEEFEKTSNPIPVFLKVLENEEYSISANICRGNYIYLIKDDNNNVVYRNELTIH